MLTYEGSQVLRDVACAFARLEPKNKFPAEVGLTVWACESAWGTKLTGDFNFWGITRPPEDGPAKLCATHEVLTAQQLANFRPDERATAVGVAYAGNGKTRYSMNRWFASYASLDESVEAYADFFINSPKRYTAAWKQYLADSDASAFLKAICEAGYATGDAETTEMAILAQSNIAHAIEAAREEERRA